MATVSDAISTFQQQWGYVPDRFQSMDPNASVEDSYLDWIAQNKPAGQAPTTTTTTQTGTGGGGSGFDTLPSGGGDSGVTTGTIRDLFRNYGVTINTPIEDEETRLQRILNQVLSGERSLTEVEQSIRGISSGSIAFDPTAGSQFGGGGVAGASTGTGGGLTGGGANVTEEDIRQLFRQFNVPIATSTESEAQRLQRILAEIQGGFRDINDVRDAISKIAGGVWANAGHDIGAQTEALPQGSRLVKVGNEYRVLWGLGEGKGWAWYSVDGNRLQQIYGTQTPEAFDYLPNSGSFDAKYRAGYWGNVAEISQTADTPWQDLTDRIHNAFGFIAGMDDPEVQALLTQAWFEGWTPDEFVAHYRNTEFFNSLSDQQRQWEGLSQAEKEARIEQTKAEMRSAYRDLWGVDPSFDLTGEATMIASGQMVWDEWLFTTRQAAEATGGTPAARDKIDTERAGREPEITQENLAAFVEEQWRTWVGPYDPPSDFAARWGKDLYMNLKSTADLEKTLKGISESNWPDKPPDVPWSDWAAPRKGQLSQLLEIGVVADNDPLLISLLTQGLLGQDAIRAIRQDPRFMRTTRMYNELSNTAEEISRLFGFTA